VYTRRASKSGVPSLADRGHRAADRYGGDVPRVGIVVALLLPACKRPRGGSPQCLHEQLRQIGNRHAHITIPIIAFRQLLCRRRRASRCIVGGCLLLRTSHNDLYQSTSSTNPGTDPNNSQLATRSAESIVVQQPRRSTVTTTWPWSARIDVAGLREPRSEQIVGWHVGGPSIDRGNRRPDHQLMEPRDLDV